MPLILGKKISELNQKTSFSNDELKNSYIAIASGNPNSYNYKVSIKNLLNSQTIDNEEIINYINSYKNLSYQYTDKEISLAYEEIRKNKELSYQYTYDKVSLAYEEAKINKELSYQYTYNQISTNSKYISQYKSAYTNIQVGNISANTNVSDLEKMNINELIDKMLFAETWNDPNYHHTIEFENVPASPVKFGTSFTAPTLKTEWNNNIDSDSDKTISTTTIEVNPSDYSDFNGSVTFSSKYSYNSGYYILNSSIGNKKTIEVPGVTDKSISVSINIYYPWYINENEYIGSKSEMTITLGGKPIIKIPETSTIDMFKASNDGISYNDVNLEGWSITEETITFGNISKIYKVYTKNEEYDSEYKHKITVTIK